MTVFVGWEWGNETWDRGDGRGSLEVIEAIVYKG